MLVGIAATTPRTVSTQATQSAVSERGLGTLHASISNPSLSGMGFAGEEGHAIS